jgi:hypothetical protein
MRFIVCITLALVACSHNSTTTTTSATVASPVWSPSPGTDSSQMPFDLPKQIIREPREVDRVRDAQIAAGIHNAIVSDPNLTDSAKEVDVTTVDGVVTLRGQVETPEDRTELDRLARTAAPGVRAVVNKIVVAH